MTGGTWPTRALESKASEQKSSSLSEFVSASGKEPCLILWVPGSPLNSGSPEKDMVLRASLGYFPTVDQERQGSLFDSLKEILWNRGVAVDSFIP